MTENVNPFLSARDETARAAEDTLGGYTSDSHDELDDLELDEEQVNPTNRRSGSKDSAAGGRMPPMMMGGGGGQAGAAGGAGGATAQQAGMTGQAAGATGAAGAGAAGAGANAGLVGRAGLDAQTGAIAGGGVAAGAAGAAAGRFGAKGGNSGHGNSGSAGGMGAAGVPMGGIAANGPGYSGGAYAPNVGGVPAPNIAGANMGSTPVSGGFGTIAAGSHSNKGGVPGAGYTGVPGTGYTGVPGTGYSGVPGTGYSGVPGGIGAPGSQNGFTGGIPSSASFPGSNGPTPTGTPVHGRGTQATGAAFETPAVTENHTSPVNTTQTGSVQGTSYNRTGTSTGVSGSGYQGNYRSSSGQATNIEFDKKSVNDQAAAWDKWSADMAEIRAKIEATRASVADFGNIEKAASSYSNTQSRMTDITNQGSDQFTEFANALQDTAEKFEEAEDVNREAAANSIKGGGGGPASAQMTHSIA